MNPQTLRKMKPNLNDPNFRATQENSVPQNPAVSTSPLNAQNSTVAKEHIVSPKQPVKQKQSITEHTLRAESSTTQKRGVIKERAVIQESPALKIIQVSDNGNEPIVFVLYASPNYQLALKIAEKLKRAGCIVFLSRDILRKHATDPCEAFMEYQQQVSKSWISL